jgi:hypothetical protein
MKNKILLSLVLVFTLKISMVVFAGCDNKAKENETVTLYGWGGDERLMLGLIMN